MTNAQLINILNEINNHRSKDKIIRILEENLDTSKLDFSQDEDSDNRVIFIYNNYKYRLAINSDGLLMNFIECKNYKDIRKLSLDDFDKFITNLEIYNFENERYDDYYFTNYLTEKSDFEIIRSMASDVVSFKSIKNDSNLYFSFKVFIEFCKECAIINFLNIYDFDFRNSIFRLNNFLNVYPKLIFDNIRNDFELENFLDNSNDYYFLEEDTYKKIYNDYKYNFDNLNLNQDDCCYNNDDDYDDDYDDAYQEFLHNN